MNKYDLFHLTDKGISSAVINNIILSGMDLSNVEGMGFNEFANATGIKKEDCYNALCELSKETHNVYNIFALTSCGVSDKVCQSLKKKGITSLFMIRLYPDILLKQKYNLTEGNIRKIMDAILTINEPFDKQKEEVKNYLESLYQDTEYMNLLKKSILKNLGEDYIMEDELSIKLEECYRYGSLMDRALEDLSNQEFIENSLFGIKKLQANLKEFIFSLSEDKTSGLLKDYLEGVPLDKLALDYGIQKEKIKTTLSKYPFPILSEDEYLDLYYSYYLNIDEFSKIFQLDKSVFRYLELKAKKPKGTRNILEMLEDERVSADVRVNIQNTLGKYAKIHGINVLKTPSDVLDIYARFDLKDTLSEKDIFLDFKKYWFNLFHEELSVNEKQFVQILDNSKQILEGKNGFRYYNSLVIDSGFYHSLSLGQYVDIEASAKIIFDAHLDLMHAYDIKDEYELYFLLKKTARSNSIEFIRKPIIVFGAGNRNNQIKSILFELSPISMADFTKAYSKVFGVNEKSFSNYAAKQFSPYYQNATFTVQTPKLREEILNMYKELLTDDFYFISDIGPLANKNGIPFQEYYINKTTLKSLGYEDGIRCIYKDKYVSLNDYVETLFKDELYLKRMDPKLISLPEFQEALRKRIYSYEYIEVEPCHYVSIEKLASDGITLELIHDFVELVKNSVYEDEIFTITSLRNKGFSHPILEKNYSDYFYSSLFIPSKDIIYQRCYSTDSVILKIRVQKEEMGISSLIEQIVESKYYMYLPDIVRDLQMIYGISLSETQTKLYISLTDIYCNPDTMLYYLNYETYKRMR